MEDFAVTDSVVEIDGGKVIDLNGRNLSNLGNVSRELRIINQTVVRLLGTFQEENKVTEAKLVSLNSISQYSGMTKVEGKILNPIRRLKTASRSYGLGSIISDGFKLEIKVVNLPTNLKEFEYGQLVRAEGILKKRTIPDTNFAAPSYFEVENLQDITPVGDEITFDVENLPKIYKYVK